MKNYSLSDTFLLRTPSLPFDGILKEINTEPNLQKQIEILKSAFSQKFIQESIFLASPSLYDQLLKWHEGNEIKANVLDDLSISFMRYLTRMSTRCTPFGLFAGCTLGKWDISNEVKLLPISSYKRHTRLDMDCIGSLVQKLTNLEGIQEYILFYPNNSLYSVGNKYRYIDYYYREKKRVHRIVSIANVDYVNSVLSNSSKGAYINNLAESLISEEVTYEESYSFIKEMILEKVLISELDLVTTGEGMLKRILGILDRFKHQSSIAKKTYVLLQDISALLLKIDSQESINHFLIYQEVEEKVIELQINFERNRLFQTDMLKTSQNCTVDKRMAGTIRRALEVLNKFSSKKESTKLDKFKKRFEERYDTSEVPLSIALDLEIGVGFALNEGENEIFDNFLQGFKIFNENKRESQTLEWGVKESFLLNKLVKAQKENQYEITILDKEVENFKTNWNDLPNSLSIMGSILVSDESHKYRKILIKSVTGYATHLIGRFTHLDSKIKNWACDIARKEQENYDENIICAEIVHIPESRLGNVLMREIIRPFEIPYLANSSVSSDCQIPVSDLTVSVRGGEIVLKSKRLNKRIIPNLGNAHNFSFDSLPVYDFLCSLQYQGLRGTLSFDWGRLSREFQFLPRVSYHNIILSQATWQFTRKDYLEIIESNEISLEDKILRWRNEWNIPPTILFVEGDNELFIDLTSSISTTVFLKEIKSKSFIILKEYLFSESDNLIRDTEEKNYSNEFICVFNKNASEIKKINLTSESLIHNRSLHVGSEWLYYKIYCGALTADEILAEKVKNITDFLIESKIISKWFFIRYWEPEFNIRLRLRVNRQNDIGLIVSYIYEALKAPIKKQLIYRVQLDTYEREIERYGDATMSLSESIFFIDSETSLDFLNSNLNSLSDKRWLYGLFSTDAILNSFQYSPERKLKVMKRLKDSFNEEFGNSPSLIKELGKKYEKHEKEIKNYLDLGECEEDGFLLRQFVEEKENAISPVANEIVQILNNDFNKIDDLICSYIHMLNNRLFISEPRKHEMVIYNFLFKMLENKNTFSKQAVI